MNGLKVSGTMLGVGFLPPLLEAFDSSKFLHSVQLLDQNGYETFRKRFDSIRTLAKVPFVGRLLAAKRLSETIYDLFSKLTGHTDQGNVLLTKDPPEVARYEIYVRRFSVKKALHIGDLAVLDGNMEAILESLGINDFFTDITSKIVDVLERHRVLVYAGQLDTLLPALNIESYVRSLNWTEATSFREQKRLFWSTYAKPRELAGYVTTTGNFSFAVVHKAGHYASMDATDSVHDLYTRFICNDFESLRANRLGSDED